MVTLDELVAILNQARCPDFARAISHGDDIVWSHISAAEITYVRRGVQRFSMCEDEKEGEGLWRERAHFLALLRMCSSARICTRSMSHRLAPSRSSRHSSNWVANSSLSSGSFIGNTTSPV